MIEIDKLLNSEDMRRVLIDYRVKKELQKQKAEGKKFISDEEIDELITKVIKEESNTPSGISLIQEERQRQIEEEGWSFEHDDGHAIGELALAAACYAITPELRPKELPPPYYPWLDFWKPSPDNRIKELQKAGALITAEIDRLQRKRRNEKV